MKIRQLIAHLPLAALTLALTAMWAPTPSQAAGPAPAPQPRTFVWIGAYDNDAVPRRPLEFVRQENGDLLIKGGTVVKVPPFTIWPVLRRGGKGHFFVLTPKNPHDGSAYWIMDFAGQRRAPGR